jgi:DNA-binding transcriptional MerR regulator
MMDKAVDAFRTISEVAEDLDIPQHVLRFWETKFTHIKPLKRGGGRRYYRPDDVDLVRGIRHLLYGQGYTIKGVQRIIKEQSVKVVMSVWKNTNNNSIPVQTPQIHNTTHNHENTDPLDETAQISEELIAAIETYDINEPQHQNYQNRSDVSIMRGGLMNSSNRSQNITNETSRSINSQNDHFSLSSQDRSALMGALQDLAECRRILDAAGRN